MDYRPFITIDPGKRGGKPCLRGLRITVYDVLEYLAAGMSEEQTTWQAVCAAPACSSAGSTRIGGRAARPFLALSW